MSEMRQSAARGGRALRLTVPIVVAGAMTVTMGLTGPVESASAAPKKAPKAKGTLGARMLAARAVPTALPAAPASVPATYRVAAGDTVSSIAGRYGVSTAALLAVNGLGWKSLIFPGQVLKLTAAPSTSAPAQPTAAAGGRHTIQRGDTVSAIAGRFGVAIDSVLSANGLSRTSIIYPGQTLAIPAAGQLTLVSNVTPIAAPAPVAPAPTTAAPALVAAAPAPAAPTTSYVIRTGDTITSIARAFGVPASAILAANGLGAAGVIFAGRTLQIPGSAAPAAATPQDGSTVTPLTPEMAANGRIVVQVGRQLGVPDRGLVIALAAAMQESGLRNLSYGDRDSVGVFQQRPSVGWGSRAQLMDVTYSARLFFGGASNPNRGITRGLLDIPGWSSLPLTQAAQAVQVSAYPTAYARWEKSATAWLAQLG